MLLDHGRTIVISLLWIFSTSVAGLTTFDGKPRIVAEVLCRRSWIRRSSILVGITPSAVTAIDGGGIGGLENLPASTTTTELPRSSSSSPSSPAAAAVIQEDPRKKVVVRLEKPGDSLGIEVYSTRVRNTDVVAIKRVFKELIQANNQSSAQLQLQEGMILRGYASKEALVNRIITGPYPIEFEFVNLAAGGDAFADTGSTIVTPQDALELARSTDNENRNIQGGVAQVQEYTITDIANDDDSSDGSRNKVCAIRSRRGDVLEIEYEASYKFNGERNQGSDGRSVVVYDASSFRGTGQPYQMVLGSGDMIPGVDQGLYDMCPGDMRQLKIPNSPLGYGRRALKKFGIPPDYVALEWRIKLVSIDGTIRKNNNDVTRDEREGRVL